MFGQLLKYCTEPYTDAAESDNVAADADDYFDDDHEYTCTMMMIMMTTTTIS